jgi:hypothetical protein
VLACALLPCLLGSAGCLGPGLEPPDRATIDSRAGAGAPAGAEGAADASGANAGPHGDRGDAGLVPDVDLDAGAETPHTSDDDGGG